MKIILVIEDNSDLTTVLKQLLEYVGFNVYSAIDGESAWRLLQSHTFTPDAILCDLTLPDISGLEFLLRIRQDSVYAQSYFVAMSGHVSEKKEALAAGANAYLPKPFSLEELEQILRYPRHIQ